MEYFELLRCRKSTRKFTSEQITPKSLSALLTAAVCSPVGSNMYKNIHLTVVQNREILDKLAQAAVKRREDTKTMQKIRGDMPPSPKPLPAKYDPFHGAPTVIFVAHRKQDIQPGIEFSNVACVAYSMHLAATDLGLGSVLIWFALESMREIPELDHTSVLELPDGFEPLLGLAVGYPVTELTAREIDSDKISVNYLA